LEGTAAVLLVELAAVPAAVVAVSSEATVLSVAVPLVSSPPQAANTQANTSRKANATAATTDFLYLIVTIFVTTLAFVPHERPEQVTPVISYTGLILLLNSTLLPRSSWQPR
jgi:hypothetical protein